jgi:hypothetical protein
MLEVVNENNVFRQARLIELIKNTLIVKKFAFKEN